MSEHFVPEIFLKFPGADGECKVSGYEQTIAALQYDFEVNADTTMGKGSGSSGGHGVCKPLSMTLIHDKGFAKLQKMTGTGTTTASGVTITRLADGHKDEMIELKNAKLTHCSRLHSHGSNTLCRIVLSFTQAEVTTYVETSADVFSVGDLTTYNMETGETT